MRKRTHNSGMWAYLDSVGVLENGTEEQIKQAKRNYKRKYIREYKQKQRKEKPEAVVLFSKENGEYERITVASKKHGMSVPAFVRDGVLAYLNKTYIIPNQMQIAHLEQLLSDCLNEIQNIYRAKGKWWDRDWKYDAVEQRVEKLQAEINNFFRNPPSLENQIKEAIRKNPFLKEKLISIISPDDSQNKIAEKTEFQKVA